MGGCCSGQRDKDKDKDTTRSDTKRHSGLSSKRHSLIREDPETAGLTEEILLVPLFPSGDKLNRSNSANKEADWEIVMPELKSVSENEPCSPKNFTFSFGRTDTEERRDLSQNMEEGEEEIKLLGEQREVSEQVVIEAAEKLFILEATKEQDLGEVQGEDQNQTDIKKIDRSRYAKIFKRNEYIKWCEKRNLEEDQDKHGIKSDSEEISETIEAKTSEHCGVEEIEITYNEENYSHDSKEIYGETDVRSGKVEDNNRNYTRDTNRGKVITISKLDEISLLCFEKSEKDNVRRIDPKVSFIVADFNTSKNSDESENLMDAKLPEDHDGKPGRKEINVEDIETSEIEENKEPLIENIQEENKCKIDQIRACKVKEANTSPDKIEEIKEQCSEKVQEENGTRVDQNEIHEIVRVELGEIECDIAENEYYHTYVKQNCKLIGDIIKNQKKYKSSQELVKLNINLREDKAEEIKENNKDSRIIKKNESLSESNENCNEVVIRAKGDQQSVDYLTLPLENESEFSNINSKNSPTVPFEDPVDSQDPLVPEFLYLSAEDEFKILNKSFRNRSLAVYSNTPMSPLLSESDNINAIAVDKEKEDPQEIPRKFVRRNAIPMKEI